MGFKDSYSIAENLEKKSLFVVKKKKKKPHTLLIFAPLPCSLTSFTISKAK